MGIEYSQLPLLATNPTRESVQTFDDLIRARNRFGFSARNEMAMFKGDGAMDKVDMRWTLRAKQLHDFANAVGDAYKNYVNTGNMNNRSLEGNRSFKLPYDLFYLLTDGATSIKIDSATYFIKKSVTSTSKSAAKGSGKMAGRALHRTVPPGKNLPDFIVHLAVNTTIGGKVLS